MSLLELVFLIKFCHNQTLLNPVSCMTPSFAQFKSTLKLEMKQGLQGQTQDQRQSCDFKDHNIAYTNPTQPIFFNVPFLLVTIKSTGGQYNQKISQQHLGNGTDHKVHSRNSSAKGQLMLPRHVTRGQTA
jgi:hypothetical protein